MNYLLALLSMAAAAPFVVSAVIPPAPEVVTDPATVFAEKFVHVAISAMAAIKNGDTTEAQRVLSIGKALGFDSIMRGPLGGLEIQFPGVDGTVPARYLWYVLDDIVFPSRDYT